MAEMNLPNMKKNQQRIKSWSFWLNRLNNIVHRTNNRKSIFFFTFKKLESMFA